MRVLAVSLIAAAVSIVALHGQQTGGSIDVPVGASIVLQAKGPGVQIYSCSDAPGGAKWVLKGPDAKLQDASGKTIGTHFAGPTWKLMDGSQVQGELIASMPSLEAGAVPWLLLRAKAGTATGTFANVAYIRRTETHGGVAPGTVCSPGQTEPVQYAATYTFYTKN